MTNTSNCVKKRRWIALLLVTAASLFTPFLAHSQADFGSLYALIAPPVVRVDSPGVGSGSGFVVQHLPTYSEDQPVTGIVTACHVVFSTPMKFGERRSTPIVNVTFSAWRPEIVMRAAVVKCDATNDAALLQPVNDAGEVITLGRYFEDLALRENDSSLRSFPRLYFGDSSQVTALDSVFVIGYPSPFAELNSLLGRVTGVLPVPHVVTTAGRVDRINYLMIYDGEPDREIDPDKILQVDVLPALDLEQLAKLAQNVLAAGHGLLLISSVQPLGTQLVGWDAVSVESGILQVQERSVRLEISIFGTAIAIGPRIESFGSVSLLREFFRMDVAVAPGHSGSPVMNINGQVIGMVEWGINGQPGANFASQANKFRESLFGR